MVRVKYPRFEIGRYESHRSTVRWSVLWWFGTKLAETHFNFTIFFQAIIGRANHLQPHRRINAVSKRAVIWSFEPQTSASISFRILSIENNKLDVVASKNKKVLQKGQTGHDLELPNDFMSDTFERYSDLFNAKNYMEGLNKVITEIAQRIIEHFKVDLFCIQLHSVVSQNSKGRKCFLTRKSVKSSVIIMHQRMKMFGIFVLRTRVRYWLHNFKTVLKPWAKTRVWKLIQAN